MLRTLRALLPIPQLERLWLCIRRGKLRGPHVSAILSSPWGSWSEGITQSLTFSHTKFQSPASKIIAEERNRP
jgi:hypothetical protein